MVEYPAEWWRCQAWTAKGRRCTRDGTRWRLGRGRYCVQHARQRDHDWF